jgi:hypothetical protein
MSIKQNTNCKVHNSRTLFSTWGYNKENPDDKAPKKDKGCFPCKTYFAFDFQISALSY